MILTNVEIQVEVSNLRNIVIKNYRNVQENEGIRKVDSDIFIEDVYIAVDAKINKGVNVEVFEGVRNDNPIPNNTEDCPEGSSTKEIKGVIIVIAIF